jgi:hypothetical protein
MTAVLISRVEDDNPCVWYFITLFSDTTFGVILSYLMLKSWESYAKTRSWSKFISGNYQSDVVEEVDLGAWAVQLMIWGLIVLIVNFTQVKVLIMALLMKASWIFSDWGHWVLMGLEPYPRLELVVVMVIIPLIMNCVQFWIQDNFLKAKGSDWSPLKE